MHIFQNIKTYDKPRNKDRLNEQKEPKKEPDSWFDAFKGCLFAIFLFVGSIALLYGIGSAVDSSEFGKDVLLIVGGDICGWPCCVLPWYSYILDSMGFS